MNKGIIYKATSKTTGLVYIGQTMKTLQEREKAHWQSKKNSSKFHDAILLLGREDFTWEVIEEVEEERLSERERYWVEFYDSYNNGYNSDTGGCYSPGMRKRVYSDKAKKTMSEKAKNRTPWNKGIHTGPCSEEMKEHLRQVWKDKPKEEMERLAKVLSEKAKGNKSTAGYRWYKDEDGHRIYYKEEQ